MNTEQVKPLVAPSLEHEMGGMRVYTAALALCTTRGVEGKMEKVSRTRSNARPGAAGDADLSSSEEHKNRNPPIGDVAAECGVKRHIFRSPRRPTCSTSRERARLDRGAIVLRLEGEEAAGGATRSRTAIKLDRVRERCFQPLGGVGKGPTGASVTTFFRASAR